MCGCVEMGLVLSLTEPRYGCLSYGGSDVAPSSVVLWLPLSSCLRYTLVARLSSSKAAGGAAQLGWLALLANGLVSCAPWEGVLNTSSRLPTLSLISWARWRGCCPLLCLSLPFPLSFYALHLYQILTFTHTSITSQY